MIFNFGEKFTPKLKITENFGIPKFLEACGINENQAWPFKVRDRAPAPPHAPKRF